MTQSRQEELIHLLLTGHLGASSAFRPDKWSKPSGGPLTEPCDLAWIANRTALLFNMTETGGDALSDMVEHNLKQLGGGLRFWAMGSRLTGSNPFRTFDLGFDDVDHHVLVSIVAGPNEGGVFHDTPAKSQYRRTRARVSLPADILTDLLSKGAGAHGLVDLALQIRDHGGEVPVVELRKMVMSTHFEAISVATATVDGDIGEVGRRSYAFNMLRDLRSLQVEDLGLSLDELVDHNLDHNSLVNMDPDPSPSGNEGHLETLSPVFNDLSWSDVLALTSVITRAWAQLDRPDWQALSIQPFVFTSSSRTSFVIGAVPQGHPDEDEIGQCWLSALKEVVRQRNRRDVVGIAFRMPPLRPPRNAVVFSWPPTPPSVLDDRLTAFSN